MSSIFIFLLLLAIRAAASLLYRVEVEWVGELPPDRWARVRVLAMLNHTSLFEPILAAAAPPRLLWQIARHGVVPIADKTAARPLVGRFFGLVARHVVPITRERDETWFRVLERIDDPEAIIVILPEGRMMRRSGLDLHGEPMTVRGGIADILRAIPEGRMLLAYSGGLHHVHAPGDRFPRLFRTVRLRLEVLEIPEYRDEKLAAGGRDGFKTAVVEDLTRRRDRCCPTGRRDEAA